MKSFISKNKLVLVACIIAITLCFGATQKAQALSLADLILFPFTGTIKSMELCCNGIKMEIKKEEHQSPIEGKFIFEWKNFIPLYQLGWGLYEGYKMITGKIVVGAAQQGGECQTIYSECEYSETVDYKIQLMGTYPN
ncbi:MAG: hypothetical protein WC629_01285 [Candidatus Paceibacterota bacterium]|jgi:hypothetical protein